MMRLCAALILCVMLSTACGLKCYTCVSANARACTWTSTCPAVMDQCFSLNVNGSIAKGCRATRNCVKPVSCCGEDLCNSAVPTGPRVTLLLVSSAIASLFL
ncbi:muscarinic toxin 2-like [Hippoglossus hippoglossus]|uniref:muscarinic toxin 2-like n=1 Tax=Hippoglossus hippoglossus TaxID=8267 RepID=UPI00148B4188|nr:muscarinic toxin 2-like [Hippoglossus hippoglossus]